MNKKEAKMKKRKSEREQGANEDNIRETEAKIEEVKKLIK